MLFNSAEFIFLFLPLSLLIFFSLAKYWGNEIAIAGLVFCSLFFYAWWKPVYLALLIASMILNYSIGSKISKNKNKSILVFGITLNLAAIAYYKYAGFIIFNLNLMNGNAWSIDSIILPLAISFFTFQQIAYLVDSYQGITKEYSFLHYALFVSFFPQLIAGPIVHHKEMLPQFSQAKRYKININNIQIGLSIFALGLFKKTVLADGIAEYATPIFLLAETGASLDFFASWGGALAYTFQLYFDFSGYSDMAIGLARLFGIILPLNFYSPYKSTNVVEFWRRWHMTLSQFLRDYLYIALGGNRKGNLRRHFNLFITMLLGGLWHGAGWNFIIWGALHGFYLIINHGWHLLIKQSTIFNNKLYIFTAWLITFIAVIIGWVFFRATSIDSAINMLYGMLGFNGFALPSGILNRLGTISEIIQSLGVKSESSSGSIFILTWCWNISLLFAVIMLPNVQDLFCKVKGSLNQHSFQTNNTFWPTIGFFKDKPWSNSISWAILTGIALAMGMLTLSQVSEFLYFQF